MNFSNHSVISKGINFSSQKCHDHVIARFIRYYCTSFCHLLSDISLTMNGSIQSHRIILIGISLKMSQKTENVAHTHTILRKIGATILL